MRAWKKTNRSGRVRFQVKVNAGAKGDSVRMLAPGYYQVRTSAPPEGGHANRRVLELLARELACEVAALRIVRGARSALKEVEWSL